ncbi:MAG: hypothetical protein SOR58_02470 [Megasphaera massiliensis]|jgi:hypothetical protein|uniref:hypothetical protein n=1 Tax=Megasphaera massiliensis TaxID=1232428 RepID=UPI002A7563B1|nr:hypothetical protein [Megasphaera massiliensis]MDY2965044.1 hypothetical protein [Megasphaera massiliensis]
MPPLITTYTGKHFDITNMDPETISIEDMAHALSLICRGNGHVKTFYSVGQHCLQCAYEVEARSGSPRLIVAALLHDGTECYMSDVPRPLKAVMPGYSETEKALLNLIYEKYLGSPLTDEETKFLKSIDDDFLWYDLTYLLDDKPEGRAPTVRVMPDYAFRPFADVEKDYLALFRRYAPKISKGE